MGRLETTASDRREAAAGLRASRPRRFRTMRQFAEQELYLTGGPYDGQRFNCARQPFTGLWFDLVDSGLWRRHFAAGVVQSGKTFACSTTPVCYHLFEVGETVIYGVPTGDMASDKWAEDLLPAIEASRYRDLLPSAGGGARGAFAPAMRFRNGATLRFMFAGGSDKTRAGFTGRVLVVTETDGFDEVGGTSREADKFAQLEARTAAYGARAVVYGECTVSIAEGRTWQELKEGTDTRIVRPCPKCSAWVTPEREHLIGWQNAATEIEARERSAFACPACGAPWSEGVDGDRKAANLRAVAVHRGQEVAPDGTVIGKPPATETLGFRWTAADNHLRSAGDTGAAEWKSVRAADHDNADKALRQWSWALPALSTREEAAGATVESILACIGETPRGIVPESAEFLTVGVDLGKHVCWWSCWAWLPGATPHVVDYGSFGVPDIGGGIEPGLLAACRDFRDRVCENGWPTAEGDLVVPRMVLFDAGYKEEVARTLARESAALGPARYWPSRGYGASPEDDGKWKNRDKQANEGEHYRSERIDAASVWEFRIDADHWKTWLHQRVVAKRGEPGALTLYATERFQHLSFAKHLTSEKEVQEYVAGKGFVTKWERKSRQNHWLDTGYTACAGAHYCGARLLREQPKEPEPVKRPAAPPPAQQVLRRDGRGWFDR